MLARRILISHAANDAKWPHAEVERLGKRLEAEGFTVDLDLWAEPRLRNFGSDTEWQDWMLVCLKAAEHVLILDSEEYARRASIDHAPAVPGRGRGVALEYTDLRNWLNNAYQRNHARIIRYGIGSTTELAGMDGKVPRLQAPDQEEHLIEGLVQVNQALVPEIAAAQAATATASPDQRSAELAYLDRWLSGDLSEHPSRYVTLAGEQRNTLRIVARKRASFSPALILQTFKANAAEAQSQPQPFPDALAAYRAVFQQRQRKHLAVLGEPGAGKSFSLERLFCELADRALEDAQAPIPLLLRLGDWTDAAQTMEQFISAQLTPELAAHWPALRAQGRAVLLLDAFNEIPVGQRAAKADAVRTSAENPQWAGVLLSCRERDFVGLLKLPFDTLTLQPLTPMQVMDFLQRWEAPLDPVEGAAARANTRFWQIAAGNAQATQAEALWRKWHEIAGLDAEASFTLFWTADDIPRDNPDVDSKTSGAQDQLWRTLRSQRSLMHLAASPYWLTLLAFLPRMPVNRAELTKGFLDSAYAQGKERQEALKSATTVPPQSAWHRALQELANALQGLAGNVADASDGAQTRMPSDKVPISLTPHVLEFSIGIQVLKEHDGQVYFSHQLLQEALAAQALLAVFATHGSTAQRFWPVASWWQRGGWEVVAELAAETYANDADTLCRLVAWLAQANPDVAADVWRRIGQPALSPAILKTIADQWAPLLTDIRRQPRAQARAAIGRALAVWDLDHRPGIGLLPSGHPDMDWVLFDDAQPFVYQGKQHRGLPPFALARYPLTHQQFQAFVDAPDGYTHERWWVGLARRFGAPEQARWPDANAPRETVSWYEAIAFCRWLSVQLGYPVTLPSEQQWERAAAGSHGWSYPSAEADYLLGHSNCYESRLEGGSYIARTTAVGIYPQGATAEGGVMDMSGNVWEWCLNDYKKPSNLKTTGDVARVLRGGSWFFNPGFARVSLRFSYGPDDRNSNIGFRVCRASHIGVCLCLHCAPSTLGFCAVRR